MRSTNSLEKEKTSDMQVMIDMAREKELYMARLKFELRIEKSPGVHAENLTQHVKRFQSMSMAGAVDMRFCRASQPCLKRDE